MTRVFTLFTILLALLAVTVPSVAVGSRGFVEHPAPLLRLTAEGSYVKTPCPLTGGNRLLVCRPDVGVMPVTVFLTPPGAAPLSPPMVDAMPHALAIKPSLPPPRAA